MKLVVTGQIGRASSKLAVAQIGDYGQLTGVTAAHGLVLHKNKITYGAAFLKDFPGGMQVNNIKTKETADQVQALIKTTELEDISDKHKALYPSYYDKLNKIPSLDSITDKEHNLTKEGVVACCIRDEEGFLVAQIDSPTITDGEFDVVKIGDRELKPTLGFIIKNVPVYNQIFNKSGKVIDKEEDYISTFKETSLVSTHSMGIVYGYETNSEDCAAYLIFDGIDPEDIVLGASADAKHSICNIPTVKRTGITVSVSSFAKALLRSKLVSESDIKGNTIKDSKFKTASEFNKSLVLVSETGEETNVEEKYGIMFVRILEKIEVKKRNTVGDKTNPIEAKATNNATGVERAEDDGVSFVPNEDQNDIAASVVEGEEAEDENVDLI